MKRTWNEIAGFPITLQDKESPLGRVSGVLMHPETGQIIAFLVGFSRVLAPVDIEKWRRDSIQINSKNALVSPSEIIRLREFGPKRTLLNGKTVLSKSKRKLGRVRDFTFDTLTNSILNLESAKSFLWANWGARIFPRDVISEVTDSAIILSIEPEETGKLGKKAEKKAAETVPAT